jgi:hypothetical protein
MRVLDFWRRKMTRDMSVGTKSNGGNEMATVKDIVDGDKNGITWIVLLDSDGNQWKYHKKGPAPAGATVHIVQHTNGKFEALPDGKGGILIHQSGPGLPATINISLQPVNPAPPGMAGVVMGGWGGGVFIYEQPI